MSIKQIHEDIAAGTYVGVRDCVNNFEKELDKLLREAYVTDDWDRGWCAALRCVKEQFDKSMKGVG